MSRQSFDEPWIFRRIVQCIAQTLHRRIQAVIEIDKSIRRPQFALQFRARNYIPGFSKQGGQDPEGLLLQLNLEAIFAQFAGAEVEFEETKTNDARVADVHHVQPSAG